ncbi:hypothetical protein [Cellulomonas bogoriensis]|uniref:Uncharacterized protein n=1 Tax=Cellulomonas bogoriensis 69B4 = DSM 16987 TaxID=1386082 RepID=A0A0A0BST3_9CELL|nr:hypothetical protein [Cellulomonas bogoriensis]KGM10194.1 hypothetical protein N869_05015 [Cellulomonas bogoriensis 69B4 = DSM 16987]
MTGTVDLTRFPWPDSWARPSRVLSAMVAGGLALAAGAGIALLVTGHVVDARGALGVATAPVLVILAVLVLRTRVLRRRASVSAMRLATPDEAPTGGVVVPFRRDTTVLRGLLSAYMGLAGLILGLGGFALVATGEVGAGGIGILLGGGLVALVVPRLRLWASSRRHPSVLVLTPEGLVHRSPRAVVAVRWHDVVSVVPSGDRDPHVSKSSTPSSPRPSSAP